MIVGVLGGGQLGRMLALAGLPLGIRFRFLEPSGSAPVDDVGEVVRAPWDDLAALRRFAEGLDVVTCEFENVPAASLETLAGQVPVFPPPASFALAGDRLNEKRGFAELGIACAPWREVGTREDLVRAADELGFPCVLKTTRLGYDGKGQVVLRSADDVAAAWDRLGAQTPLVLEGFVDFRRELSIVGVRGRDGVVAFWPLVENVHEHGVLVRTIAPAEGVTPALQAAAEDALRRLMEHVGHVGVMALELFEVGGATSAAGQEAPADAGRLLANEVAPRVHNSGHWTQDGATTSQFENHVRAVAGLPLGPTDAVGVSEMVNLLGALPALDAVLAEPLAHLHLYGKAPRPGRKLGHVNVWGHDRAEVDAAAERIAGLARRSGA